MLVVMFDYTKHPTAKCFVTIVETLGTISEYNWDQQVDFFIGDGKTTTFYLQWVGVDTSRVVAYTSTSIAYTIDEWGKLVFKTPPATETDVIVVYYLKQPPIHPCRPIP